MRADLTKALTETADYNLVVTQNAAFDTEANNSFATAQAISWRGCAHSSPGWP